MTAKAGSRQAQSLNAQELQDFCQIGLKLVSSGSSETRHQVLTTLATDEGLARVREVVEIDLCRFDHEVAMENFERIILSLLQTIAHREVLSSLVLETSRGTIYNVIFGIEGRRAVSFLRGILLLLKEAASRRASGDQVLVQSLSSVLTVFAQVIECNQMAYIVPDFQDFLYEFELLLDSSIGPIRSLVAQQANHQLLRIRKRLEKGATIDLLVDRKNDAPVLNSGFEVTTEGPGDLCSDGSRHDNDHEDICRIQIMPTVAEIRSNRSEYLPVTDPTKFHVTGMKGLLDRQFRLLREDTIGQLRDCVRCVLEEFSSPSYKPRAEKRTQHGTRYLVYQSVVLSDVVFEAKQNIGLQVIAEFDQPFTVRSMKSKVERQRWWSETKQLQVGSLLCLVDSAGRSLFLSVSRRDAISDISPSTTIDHNLSLHIGDQNNTLNPMATADSAIPEKRDLWNDQFRCAIMLQLVDLDTYGIGEIVGRSQSETHVKQVLVEFPGVLLPSFRPTLEALKEMSRDLDIPFASLLATQDELVAGTIHSISPPAYAFQPGFSFDLGSITGNIPMFLDPLKPFDIAHLVRHSTLDEAQCEALVNALRREFAVIQGPPGTGKSYVAVQLVRILLKQREETEIGPIICVYVTDLLLVWVQLTLNHRCYTNHALDGCLEHILAQGTDKIIRLGAGSKSTILEPFNLRNIAMNTEDTKTGRHSAWQALTKVKESSKEVVSLLQNLKQSGSPRMVKGYLEGAYPYYLQQFLDTTDEEGFTFVRNERKDPLESWLAGGPNGSLIARTRPSHALNPCNLFDLGREERNILYSSWTKTIRESLTSELNVAIEANLEAKKRLRQCRSDLDLRCLEKSHIIGLTTSGLARHIDLLRRLNPKVLICEEAGEILEAHTLTAFLPTIEHAILIGDHEQLRPQVQNYDLSIENPRGQKYSLDVSLFERLVRQSGSKVTIPHSSLRIQRRMDPSISKLIKDTIYPRLEDHEAVATYPPVVGMRKRLFWLDHRIAEARCDTNQSLSTSHWNDWEIDMIAALVTHLVRQGVYKSEEIAVLTPYVRQLQRIRNVLKSTFDIVLDDRDEKELEIQEMVTADPKTDEITGTVINRDVGPKIQKITISQRLRIATVDNFQGEEAKVVLVSLVRSNEQRSCGFLRTTNRINVLLSRAKHGMYIIGNSETYSRIEMWAKVIEMLRGGQNLGPQLGLCCPRHPDTSIEVSVPDDFVALSPEGGCALQCGLRLRCGHVCSYKCHSDSRHEASICQEPCPRRRSTCEHICPLVCGEECRQVCHFDVGKVQLPCGHTKARTKCYQAQKKDLITCHTMVEKLIPTCGHTVSIQCHEIISDDFQCLALCTVLLPCGHSCQKKCSSCRVTDPDGTITLQHGACITRCFRPYTACKHTCEAVCHENSLCPDCSQKCQVACCHSRCAKVCQEPCAPCAELCSAGCEHRGQCQLPCAVPCNNLPCNERCGLLLTCGHRCPSICGENCPDPIFCQKCAPEKVLHALVDFVECRTYAEIDLNKDPIIIPTCGHIVTRSSLDGHMAMSTFYEMDAAGIIRQLAGTSNPFSVEDVKACPTCRAPLRDIHRYGRIVKRGLIDEATKRFIVWANSKFVPLEAELHDSEMALSSTKVLLSPKTNLVSKQRPPASGPWNVELSKSRTAQIEQITELPGLSGRYDRVLQVRSRIRKFSRQVSELEQPFGKVYQMVEDVRRTTGQVVEFPAEGNVLRVRERLLTFALLYRCDLNILSDFVKVYQDLRRTSSSHYSWTRGSLTMDLKTNRRECLDLADDAQVQDQPMQEIEARVYFARMVTLERALVATALEGIQDLVQQARTQLEIAQRLCSRSPNTKTMLVEVETVLRELRDSTFYTTVSNDEKRAVYKAMAIDFRGTGHWYYCRNGHLVGRLGSLDH